MRVILFGSYLSRPETANDVDIAIVTDRVHGGSYFGRFIAAIVHAMLSPFFTKKVDVAVYSMLYLDHRDAEEKEFGPRRRGVYLKESILKGKSLLSV